MGPLKIEASKNVQDVFHWFVSLTGNQRTKHFIYGMESLRNPRKETVTFLSLIHFNLAATSPWAMKN